MVPNILETEEERRAREMELERARFGLGVGGPMAPSGSDKPFVAPPAFADPSGPAKTASASDAVYGSSPAAMLFRQKTAQIAPSAPMARGFEPNPIKFNNELNIPNKPQQAPKQLDVLAPPTAGEPPLGAAEKPKPGTEDIIGPPARQQSLRQRQIEGLREEIANWKTSWWDRTKFSNRQAEYQNKLRALDQLEQAEAAEQRVRREDRDYNLNLEKFNFEKSKPLTVSPDASLATPKPGGGFEFTPAPSRPTPQKPFDALTARRDKDGNVWTPVFDPNSGTVKYEKAPFLEPEPKDPFATLAAREAQKIEGEGRADTRKQQEEARADEKRRREIFVKQAFEIDGDNKKYPTLGVKRRAKREAAQLLGLPDPFGAQPDGKVDLSGAKQKPAEAAAPAAPAGGVDAVVTRDANGNLVMSPAR